MAAALVHAGVVPKRKIIALYVRVSTGHQVDKDSLPFQRKELRAYCKHMLHCNMDDVEIFEDAGRSGKDTKRPAFEHMMKLVRAGLVSHVIVYKIDRISRNLVDFSLMYDDFKYNRVTFVSLNEQFDTSSAIGEAVLKIILVFAELERKLTSERVKDIMINRAVEGLWNGARMPYGWEWDEVAKFPKHSETEAVFARLMYDMYEETHSSCKIRDYNNTHDIPTKRGGEWTSKTIADFIRNPMNKGDYRYNYRESARGRKKPDGEVVYVPGVFPPLVPPEQWDRCNAIMDENAAKKRSAGFSHARSNIHVFAGLLVCAKCGGHFHSVKKDRRRANGFQPSLYACGNAHTKRTCHACGASDVKIGPFVFNYIANMVRASNMRRKIKTPEELESLLLSGPVFADLGGLSSEGLNNTFALLSGRPAASGPAYEPDLLTVSSASGDSTEAGELKQKLSRLQRALKRLKDAYLFNDEGMDEKEYLETKMALDLERIQTENKMRDLSETTFATEAGEIAFVKSASSFLLAHKIQSGDPIVYSDFAATLEDETLKDFVNLILDHVIIDEGRVSAIVFRNGLEHNFLYHE